VLVDALKRRLQDFDEAYFPVGTHGKINWNEAIGPSFLKGL
jgi:hypothetical protein